MSTKSLQLPITTFCDECGSDLEIKSFDLVRVVDVMELQFTIGTCEKCKEAWQDAGADSADMHNEERADARAKGFF